MKDMKQFLMLTAFFALSQIVMAQDFEVPKKYKLKKNEDFAKYEKDVIDCVNWLENTPINEEPEKRKDAYAFLMAWMTGSPSVTIELNESILGSIDNNKELVLIFMGGWTKYAIENPIDQKDQIKCTLAGLKSVIKVYKMGNGIKKDKNVEKIVKLDDNGELEEWVKNQLKK